MWHQPSPTDTTLEQATLRYKGYDGCGAIRYDRRGAKNAVTVAHSVAEHGEADTPCPSPPPSLPTNVDVCSQTTVCPPKTTVAAPPPLSRLLVVLCSQRPRSLDDDDDEPSPLPVLAVSHRGRTLASRGFPRKVLLPLTSLPDSILSTPAALLKFSDADSPPQVLLSSSLTSTPDCF